MKGRSLTKRSGNSATWVAVIVGVIAILTIAYVLNAPAIDAKVRSATERFHQPEVVEVVLVHSRGCPHCVRFEPAFDRWIDETRSRDTVRGATRLLKVRKLEASQARDEISTLNITGYPTVLLIKNGRETTRKIGAVGSDVLEAMLNA